TKLALAPPPHPELAHRVSWPIDLAPGAVEHLELGVECRHEAAEAAPATRAESLAAFESWIVERRARAASLTSNNESFNLWWKRSQADLDMRTTATPQGPYAYAGIPWFCTAFGRDGLIVGLECLWHDPALAAGALRYLAACQATALDPASDAEPGKILHETR